jgi:fermentation-respiration switch protein FrsA (DUF1100 family)
MRHMARIARLIAFFVTVWPCPAPAQPTRPLRPQDVIGRERLQPSLSPDGEFVLYLRRTQFARPGTRLFVVNLANGTERDLTPQIDPRAHIIAWAWSPSGRRIAVAGATGPSTTVWFGDRDSGRLEPIAHPTFRTSDGPAFAWASEHELILSTLPGEEIGMFVQGEDLTSRQWAKTNEGIEPSRSVLESGSAHSVTPRRTGAWVLLNLHENSATSVPDGGIPTRTIPSHSGNAAAGLFRGAAPRIDGSGLILESSRSLSIDGLGLAIVKAERGALIVRRIDGVEDVVADGMSWSQDDKKLVFFARQAGGGRQQLVFVYDVRGDSLVRMNTAGLGGPVSLAPFGWSSHGSLLVLMSSAADAGKPPGRADWWVVRSDAPPRNLTAAIAALPMQIPSPLATQPDGSLVGVVGADLWRLGPDGGPPVKLGTKAGLAEVMLEWPRESRAASQVVVTTKKGDDRILGQFDPKSGEFMEIARPAGQAFLSDFHPGTGAAVFDVSSGRESSLWACAQAEEVPFRLAEANAHLRNVSTLAMKAIEYEPAKGQKLHGWLVLPPGFTPDRRWPLVAYVYPGEVFSEQAQPWLHDNVELLAGHGYVVLLPSMPRPQGSASRDPYDALAQQVLPAVDKAIELGIADSQRLGVMGHSFGGYAVYGLVTQTNRFQAAIASAGLTNLVSNYGQFDPRLVRSDFPFDETHHLSWSESGQGGLGDPLWKVPARYNHNSPIQYVGRVETPILMLHGDLDFVPIHQAEEFFTSLARRGKRARFVRYWGEGHLILTSPANYVDYWQQVFAWFDELLAKPSG